VAFVGALLIVARNAQKNIVIFRMHYLGITQLFRSNVTYRYRNSQLAGHLSSEVSISCMMAIAYQSMDMSI
jgi:hypothetical protein